MSPEFFLLGETNYLPPIDSEPLFSTRGFDTVVFYHNPGSTRHEETPAAIERMKRAADEKQLQVVPAETSPDPQENLASVQSLVTPGSIVAVRTGDGGFSAMLSAMKGAGLTNPVLGEQGGSKNDGINQLFSRYLRRHPEHALDASVIRTIRPITARISRPGEAEEVLDAWWYMSGGVTGKVAQAATAPEWRQAHEKGGLRTYLDERLLAFKAIARAASFRLSHSGGKARPAIDIIAANGNIMAGGMHPRQDIFESGFRLIPVRNRLTVCTALGGMILKLPVGKAVAPDTPAKLSFTAINPVVGQIDGEPLILPDGTAIELSAAETGASVLTDRRG